MSEHEEAGGPTFPLSRLGYDANGMTLRDYFAAKAMQAYVLARPKIRTRLLQPQRG